MLENAFAVCIYRVTSATPLICLKFIINIPFSAHALPIILKQFNFKDSSLMVSIKLWKNSRIPDSPMGILHGSTFHQNQIENIIKIPNLHG